jgi:hypothetical protein
MTADITRLMNEASYGRSATAERLLSFTSYRALSPIVRVARRSTESANGTVLQDGVEQPRGIRLPVLDGAGARSRGLGNVARTGLPVSGALLEGNISQLPPGVIWIVTRNGRIAIPGSDAAASSGIACQTLRRPVRDPFHVVQITPPGAAS